MKISKKQFEKMIALLKTLTGQARADLLEQLKTAEVYDTDAEGNEVKIEVEIVEKDAADGGENDDGGGDDDNEGEEKAKERGVATTLKVVLDDAEIEKAVDAAIKKANEEAIKRNRKVFAIGTPRSKSAMPERLKRARVKNFRAYEGQEFTPQERAYRFGMFIRGLVGHRDALHFCHENDIAMVKSGESPDLIGKDHVEGINANGGVLVPEEFDGDLIDLREQFGLFRQWARQVSMGSETKTRLRRTGGLTANFVGEQQAGTKSTKTWDRVNLVAKKVMAIAVVSNELNADSIINIGDDLAAEIAYAFADKEDDCGFNGDATSTYGGIVGIRTKLTNINGVDDGGGLVLGAGNAWSELTLANFQSMIAILPQYAERTDTAWIVHKTFWGQVMQPLATAAGGTTQTEIINGNRVPMFLGYPVRISQKMPSSQANSQVCALFGSLSQSSDFGDRQGTSIAISTEGVVDGVSLFETGQMAIRGDERFDINNHDLGTAAAAGPVVGLITASA